MQVQSESGWPYPPSIVIERGESLDVWAQRIDPDFSTILQVRPSSFFVFGMCSRRSTSPRSWHGQCTLLHSDHHASRQVLSRGGPFACTLALSLSTGCRTDRCCCLQVLCHVTRALVRLHAAGLAHRDMKPGNILWRPEMLEWTLIDFGVAASVGATPYLVWPRFRCVGRGMLLLWGRLWGLFCNKQTVGCKECLRACWSGV